MPTVHTFQVVPALPESLSRLREIAYNLRWAWNHEAVELFRRLDRDLWETCEHNPVRMLSTIAQERLQDAAQDESFLGHLERVARDNYAYIKAANSWYKKNHAPALKQGAKIAYFSMEFGLTECLPIYSGGLGVLAGDHLKSSSDLDLPLVAMGLLYQQGYFRQSLNGEGWQQERYPENDFYHLPIEPERTAEGKPLRVCVDFPGRSVYAQVWKAQVGRIPLYLLDTNIAENSPADQNITDQLYGGGEEMRLKQEMVLGIGGLRALAMLGVKPTICHMNEGHSAFLALERVRMMMAEQNVDLDTAKEVCAAGNLFTTHTPVPAGFDVFSKEMLGRYFGPYIETLGMNFNDFMAFGRVHAGDDAEKFNMAILALHNAHSCNGVSALHGEVTRHMVQSGYSGFPVDEVPVQHVTNGVHTRSFLSADMVELLDRYLGGKWAQELADPAIWAKVNDIPDEELWRVKQRRRERTIAFARERLKRQYENRGMSEFEIRKVREVLHPDALTIGFARRFATYKRAALLLSDAERIARLLTDPKRPVQIILAGKAHPRDDGGKELIQKIVQFARTEEVRSRIVFLEDYDMNVARYLVQGVDVWLNTPRRPMEASGTSGMKVLANGGLNLSIPDGWWAEGAMHGQVGWSIGRGEDYSDPDYQDRVEASMLYDLLEKEVIPLFYDRNTEGVPRAWIARVKNSMRELVPVFNTHRMVAEYATKFYFPATQRYHALMANDLARAKNLLDWKRRVGEQWNRVRVENVETSASGENVSMKVGSAVRVTTRVHLGDLKPQDVSVQAYHGPVDTYHEVTRGHALPLVWKSSEGDLHRYEGDIPCATSGMQGLSVRILPHHPDAALPQELPLITWE